MNRLNLEIFYMFLDKRKQYLGLSNFPPTSNSCKIKSIATGGKKPLNHTVHRGKPSRTLALSPNSTLVYLDASTARKTGNKRISVSVCWDGEGHRPTKQRCMETTVKKKVSPRV